MSWDIVYTAGARRDLRDIYEYIAYELLVPETAAGQTQRIMKEIRALDEMPMRFRLYEEEPWHSEGLRFFPVDNYLVFYLPEDKVEEAGYLIKGLMEKQPFPEFDVPLVAEAAAGRNYGELADLEVEA